VRLILLGLQDRLMPIIDPTEREPDRSVRRTSHGLPPCEVRWVLRRLEFHHVPKHASWLNMVEIEIGVLRSQRLDRRIAVKRSSLFGK
jgi:DDE superfamily endonuclease